MAEEIKSVDAKIDAAEAAVKKYASKDTVISIGGYEFTPAKLMVAATVVSSILGGLYGTFEVYKDYQSMKKKIAEYVTPDLTEVYKKLEVIQTDSAKTAEYTRDIKNDLKNDIRRVETVVEQVERASKQSQREAEQAVQAVRNESRAAIKESEQHMKEVSRESQAAIKSIQRDIDSKIQKALDNPLAK
jgi:uncharacterized protein YoxC